MGRGHSTAQGARHLHLALGIHTVRPRPGLWTSNILSANVSLPSRTGNGGPSTLILFYLRNGPPGSGPHHASRVSMPPRPPVDVMTARGDLTTEPAAVILPILMRRIGVEAG